ncbi:DUF3027 domain-containing protein [Citricoccus sp. GCM10030269]|uniref:DUF3027 domain-containing protein n=1 Tax=Citricoccus sp. GCM10030269 TaxID=3273388 RepID=UPI00361C97CF
MDPEATTEPAVRIPPKPTRAPRKRAPKLDEVLAAAVDEARNALEGLAEPAQIGEHVGAEPDDDRLVTHRFTAKLSGYRGWEWFVTLSRAPRSKVVTVCETGLLPGADAIVAPDWVPWSERVSQEEKIRLEAIAAGEDPEKALARAAGVPQDEDQPSEASSESSAEDSTEDSTEPDSTEPAADESSDPSAAEA